ncbi:hypothetical protein UFOVP1004_61, partial [uncultured Caudovirales phage]
MRINKIQVSSEKTLLSVSRWKSKYTFEKVVSVRTTAIPNDFEDSAVDVMYYVDIGTWLGEPILSTVAYHSICVTNDMAKL